MIGEIYLILSNNFPDERTASWPMVQSVKTVILIALSYIFIVTSIGPKLMENRKPYNLKGIIIVYNTFQVVACTILFTWVNEIISKGFFN